MSAWWVILLAFLAPHFFLHPCNRGCGPRAPVLVGIVPTSLKYRVKFSSASKRYLLPYGNPLN
jgi:hypothetical protein